MTHHPTLKPQAPEPDVLLELADRFESRGVWLVTKGRPDPVGEDNGLYIYAETVASAAHCFTIAAGLRSRAKGLSQ